MRPKPSLRSILLLPLLILILLVALVGRVGAAPQLPPEDVAAAPAVASVETHRLPRPAGLSWNAATFCYDAVEPLSFVDAGGARWWPCYSRGPWGTGQYVVRSTETESTIADLGFAPAARGGLSLNPNTGALELTYQNGSGPEWLTVPGFVPRGPLYGVALPLVQH